MSPIRSFSLRLKGTRLSRCRSGFSLITMVLDLRVRVVAPVRPVALVMPDMGEL